MVWNVAGLRGSVVVVMLVLVLKMASGLLV